MRKRIQLILLIISILVIVGLLIIPFHFSLGSRDSDTKRSRIDIIAHRGASGVAPENTMPAFDSAIADGADYIELDVHLTKDNKVVVMHDRTVNRTTNGSGKISNLDSDYIETLDAGSWFGEPFANTRVPLLEDVIKRVGRRAKLLIEIKKSGESNTGIEKKVAELIYQYEAENWCTVQSFNDDVLETFHQNWPDIVLHKLFVFKFRFLPYVFDGKITYFDVEKYDYVSAFTMHQRFAEKSFLKKIHAAGKKANAWGCSNKGSCKLENMRMWDGIITNYPGFYKDQSYK